MKVTVLIPTLNRLGYLREALGSARGQSYTDLEILVSDDGSKDGSQEYVREVEREDPRVRLLPPNPQPGLFTNINYLVGQVGGDAFCILGDDDLLLPHFVERLVAPMLADPGVIASFADHWVIDPAGRRLPEESEANSRNYGRASLPTGPVADALTSALKGSMCMGFSLYRTAAFLGEIFDLQCGGAADFDYAIRAAQRGTLYYVGERLGEYRSHPTTATGTRPRFMIDGAIHAFSKHVFTGRHETLRREMLRSRYRARIGYVCSESRREWAESVRQYLRLGGALLDGRVVLSGALALLPHAVARRVKRRARTAAS